MACSDETLENIIECQYQLVRHANLDIISSNNMPDFERIMIIGMLIRDVREENKAIKDAAKNNHA